MREAQGLEKYPHLKMGVVFVGQVFRWFRISKDVAFRSLWPIFAVILFSAPLIGMLLSNGFAYMLFHALFIRVQKYENAK